MSHIASLGLHRRSCALLAIVAVIATMSAAPGGAGATSRTIAVIVQAAGAPQAADAVRSVGGEINKALPIVRGVAARIRVDALAALRAVDGVTHVTPDAPMSFQGGSNQVRDGNSEEVRSKEMWSRGGTGRGTTVAVLDTGIYHHPDLNGRVVGCADLTAEAQTGAKCADTFGHGTFMAGLIAGDGTLSSGTYIGSAPQANLVAVKAAGYDGSTDVSTILHGIQWVVAHKDRYNIRVLNLSLGTDSLVDHRISPLNYAVQKAWRAGIVVVVSSGNTGPGPSTVLKPGDDPFVITVGAADDMGTLDAADDKVAGFSGRGPTRGGVAKPDIVAPGVHTVSLRSPGSAIDRQFGATAVVDGHYFKGTGTSMATATVSGVVAQMLSHTPTLTPNQVKHRLMETARPIADADPYAAGKGLVDAVAASTTTLQGEANQGLEASTGGGSLGLDRGTLDVDLQVDAGPVQLTGELTASIDPLVPGSPATWDGMSWHEAGWDGMSWHGLSWHGLSWHGMSWHATTWDGMSWHGMSWHNVDWDGMSWHDMDWSGMSWHATTWQSKWYAAAWD